MKMILIMMMQIAIDNVPIDDHDMVNQIIGIVNSHVSEVWPPPRVTKLAHKFKHDPGFALDIQTNDDDGNPWDFNDHGRRQKAERFLG